MFRNKSLPLFLFVLLLIGAVLMAGCGPSAPAGEEAAKEDRIEKIQEAGKIRVGVIGAPPFALKDPKTDEWIGAQVNLAHKVAEELGVEVEFVETTWENLVPGLVADKYDVSWVPSFHTPKRALVVDFIEPDYMMGMCPMTRADRDDINEVEDLNSSEIRFVTHPGTATEMWVNKVWPNATHVSTTEKGTVAYIGALLADRADACMIDSVLVSSYLQVHPELKSVPADCGENPLFKTELGAMIALDQPHFRHFLDTVVRYYKNNGDIARWYEEFSIPDYLLAK